MIERLLQSLSLLKFHPGVSLAVFSFAVWLSFQNQIRGEEAPSAETKPPSRKIQWQPLFDGKSLKGWKETDFGGQGDVAVENGNLKLEYGETLTGITYSSDKELPTTNYEIALEAMRTDGIDFFCGLTFPVDKSHCSLIVGGWAGTVVGLSSIDGKDASDNDTTRFMTFKNNQWYKIRLRVTSKKIQAWIDDKRVVDQNTEGRQISTRNEVDLSKPLGISVWQSEAALRNVRLRQLSPDEE